MKESTIQEFLRLVDEGKIEQRLNEQPSTNIACGTMGGEVFWDNIASRGGWRIQKNLVFGNCRILDPDNIRRAWGTEEYVSRRIMNQPMNLLVNYLHCPHGEGSFAYYPTEEPHPLGTVVLVHGLFCRNGVLEWMARNLSNAGYDAYTYEYRSSKQGITELAQDLIANLPCLTKRLPKGSKVHFLTHSMGGLILRKALELDTDGSLSAWIDRIVLLAPPNQGSIMADIATAVGLDQFNKSIGDLRFLEEADSEVKHIGVPAHYKGKIGIIAGIFDGKVIPQDSIAIPDMHEGTDYEIKHVIATHPGLLYSDKALEYVLEFYKTGTLQNSK